MIVKELLLYNGITLHYLNVRDDDHGINLLEPRIHAHFMEAASYISRYEEMDYRDAAVIIIRSLGNIRLTVSRRQRRTTSGSLSCSTSPWASSSRPIIRSWTRHPRGSGSFMPCTWIR